MIKQLFQQHSAAQGRTTSKRLAGLVGVGLLLAPAVQAQTANALSGAYTINSAQTTAGTNFASFSDAATRLNTDGVSGPVTITVAGGPYTEQFLLNEVAGTSVTNTLTINGGGRTIQFASANNTQRAVVQLNGTDYTTINNLVINAAGGTYGCGILLTNVANNDKLTNNVITTDLTSTSLNFAGIATSGSTSSYTAVGVSANNLLIEGNTVTGGYYGISLYGNTAAAPNSNNIIRNNQVKDFYVNGIYLGFQEGTIIVGNDISRPTRASVSGFNGIYAFGSSRGLAIEKNRLHDPFTGAPTANEVCYPIFLATGSGATASNYNDVVNNVIYNLNGAGTQYGVYNFSSAFVRIYNNSISADDQSANSAGTTYGIYSAGASNDVRNNVVRITRAGTGIKYALYYGQAQPSSDYNDLYVPGGNVGYYVRAYTTLADWKTANSGAFDTNSLSVDPQYVSPATGNLRPLNAALNDVGQVLARVVDDIQGTLRPATPDLGAYEFTPVAIDVLAQSLVSPAPNAGCYGTAEALSVQILNGGTAALNFATNAVTVTVVVTPPTGAAQTFTTTLTSGTLASASTQTVTLPGTLNMSSLGTYSFAVTATAVGDANPSNDLLAPAPTRTAVAPVAGTLSPGGASLCRSGTASLTLSGAANGTSQYQSSSSASGPFTDVAGATSAAFTTPTLTSTTYYRVRTTCNTNTVYSNVATITVNNPQLVSVTSPVTVCANTTATLSGTASTGSSVRFYVSATGGSPLASTSATTAVTSALSASTTYYAEAYNGSIEQVGPAANTIGLGAGTNTTYALVFTNTAPAVLTTVSVYPTVAGVSNIRLLDNTGAVLQTYQATFTAADLNRKTPVTLNFPLPAATGLQLQLLSTGSTASLYRNTAGAVYPYTSPSGQISITGNTFSSGPAYYYYFYDWEVNTECASTAARTAVQVNVTPAPATPTLTASPQASGAVLLTASPAVAGATYQFYRNGSPVGAASTATTLSVQGTAANGNYTVTLTSGGCASAQSVAVGVAITGTRPTATLNGVSLWVYPSPTPDGQLTLELTGARAQASALTVVNALGQVVLARPVAPGTAPLDLGGLAAGVYTLRVQTPDGVLTQRVVRE